MCTTVAFIIYNYFRSRTTNFQRHRRAAHVLPVKGVGGYEDEQREKFFSAMNK
jgi:hypothetical protein